MEPNPEIVARIFTERVARAREMAPEDKLLEGPRLFDRACRVMADGVRHRHPELGEEEVQARVRAYLARLDEVERAR